MGRRGGGSCELCPELVAEVGADVGWSWVAVYVSPRPSQLCWEPHYSLGVCPRGQALGAALARPAFLPLSPRCSRYGRSPPLTEGASPLAETPGALALRCPSPDVTWSHAPHAPWGHDPLRNLPVTDGGGHGAPRPLTRAVRALAVTRHRPGRRVSWRVRPAHGACSLVGGQVTFKRANTRGGRGGV